MKRVCWLLFCCLTWGLVTAVMCGAHSRAWATPATVELEAVLQSFQPLQPRTENEQDRVLAAAQYSLGRIQFQRGFSGSFSLAETLLEVSLARRDVGVRRADFAVITANAMHDHAVHANPRKIHGTDDMLEILVGLAFY